MAKQDQQQGMREEIENRRFSFLVEWYDPIATLVRQYVLSYFDFDDTIEMVLSSIIYHHIIIIVIITAFFAMICSIAV